MAPQFLIREVKRTFTTAGGTVTALDVDALAIERGEYLSVRGHSGSGKTTFLSIIGGMLRPSSGSVAFEGRGVYDLSRDDLARFRAEKVGFLFQSADLLPSLTVTDNLLLPTLFAPQTGAHGTPVDRAGRLLRAVGLEAKTDALPYQLSGGEMRRVSLARALMNGPEVLLADEPTGDLDEGSEALVIGLLETLRKASGTTLIIVTHDADIARRAERQLIMGRGKFQTA
jgi:putative ABC transport system ATP-binding protein/lipoprotein-releasing system ATP-binding protein